MISTRYELESNHNFRSRQNGRTKGCNILLRYNYYNFQENEILKSGFKLNEFSKKSWEQVESNFCGTNSSKKTLNTQSHGLRYA